MITKEEIQELRYSLETSRVERTISTSNMDKFQEAICAFANDMSDSRKNGYLLIGVNDDGSLNGLKVDDALFKRIAGIRSDGNILPLPMMTVEKYTFDDGDVLVVEVQPSFSTPVRYRGRTFIRIGPRRDIASTDEEHILIEKRTANMATFDASPCLNATLDDLFVDKLSHDYLPRAVDPQSLLEDTRDLKHKMASLGLFDLAHNCPTYAAIILFAKHPKCFLPGCYLQYVSFNGGDKAADIDDEKTFDECLAVLLSKLPSFVDYGVITSYPVAVNALQEKMVKNYPTDAVREILMNACMHRDYQSNMPIRFYSFADRIEVMNAGGLYGKARPENFPDVNDYRNPIVAEAMKVLGYVNKYNRGINRVKKLLAENGNPEPQFNVDKITVFEVVMQINGKVSNRAGVNAGVNVGANAGVNAGVNVNAQSRKILMFCEQPKSRREIFAHIGVIYHSKNFKSFIEPLVDVGYLELTIPSKPKSPLQKYKLTSKGIYVVQFAKQK